MRIKTAYEGPLGDHFAALADDSPYNAHIDRPALLAPRRRCRRAARPRRRLRRRALHRRVARTGRGRSGRIEGGRTLLAHARERLDGDTAVTLHHHDLEEPLAFLADDSFDLAIMALVLHHIEARRRLLAELRRVLRPGRRLLVSTTHPTADWTYFGGSHFDESRVELPIKDGTVAISGRPPAANRPRRRQAHRPGSPGDRDKTGHLPKICTQQTITLRPGDLGAKDKLRQDLHYLSPAWQGTFKTIRANTEGINGRIKGQVINLSDPTNRLAHGRVAQTLLVALMICIANQQILLAWRQIHEPPPLPTPQQIPNQDPNASDRTTLNGGRPPSGPD